MVKGEINKINIFIFIFISFFVFLINYDTFLKKKNFYNPIKKIF